MAGNQGPKINLTLVFFSLLYGMPAPTAEHQLPEAWPASTQRHGQPAPRGMASQHLRTFERVPAVYSLFAGILPAAYSLFAGTVLAFNLFHYWKNC